MFKRRGEDILRKNQVCRSSRIFPINRLVALLMLLLESYVLYLCIVSLIHCPCPLLSACLSQTLPCACSPVDAPRKLSALTTRTRAATAGGASGVCPGPHPGRMNDREATTLISA